MELVSVRLLSIFAVLRTYLAVPPEACFANFRWDDCGKSPVPVMYYWKPGSRCEVGLWRGCLPSLNMFEDEYECVTTCIFTARAMSEDYHSSEENEKESQTFATETVTEGGTEDTTEMITTTDNNVTETATDSTTVLTEKPEVEDVIISN